jgi:hypothetical protein
MQSNSSWDKGTVTLVQGVADRHFISLISDTSSKSFLVTKDTMVTQTKTFVTLEQKKSRDLQAYIVKMELEDSEKALKAW